MALYTYDALANSVEERVFLESSRSFEALQAELNDLAYVHNRQQFYLYLDGSIFRIDLNTLEYETAATEVGAESCVVSSDGRFAAWQQENSLYESGSVSVMDLETGSRRSISAQEGCYIPVSYTHLDVYKRQVWGEGHGTPERDRRCRLSEAFL